MVYKLGNDKIKSYVFEGQQSWADYGVRHPIMRKLIVIGLAVLGMFVILGGLAPQLPPEYTEQAKSKVSGLFSDKGSA